MSHVRLPRLPTILRVVGIASFYGVLAACAGLPTQSFVAPSAKGKTYDGFLAYAAFSDLAVAGAYESAMCDRLLTADHACENMLQAAPPTSAQNGISRHRAALASGAQAVITIELADPNAASRRILADGRPGYRISVLDVARQKIVARFAIEGLSSNAPPSARARAVAKAVLGALKRRGLLKKRA